VQVEREIYGTGTPDFQPFSGWWWNADESGSGYSVELQGNNLFIVGFMYDDTGRPIWYFSAGPMTDDSTYHGDVLQFANGQTIAGTYRPPSTPAKIATLDVAFTGMNEATLTFTGMNETTLTFTEATASAAARVAKAARSSTRNVQPQFPKKSTYVPPKFFTGILVQNGTGSVKTVLSVTIGHTNAALNGILWTHNRDDTVLPYDYDLTSGTAALTIDVNTTVKDASNCMSSGSIQLPLGGSAFDIQPGESILSVDGYKKYYLDAEIAAGQQSFLVPTTCTFADGSSMTRTDTFANPKIKFNLLGTVVRDAIKNSFTKTVTTVDPDGTTTTTTLNVGWNFNALR
jgi:hypothetical protein